ncbi:MAG TPA: AI-2E family transporter [Actinomycetota bacterium]|jgi:predicted PurR-regulated permease PerM|nr:AI-2E family transporter [Actinomycetota bacterium]
MPPWIPKATITVLLCITLFALAVVVLWRVRDLAVWLLVSLFLSFALEPGVNWLARRGWPRGVATAVLMLVALAALAVVVAAIIPVIAAQIRLLVEAAPGWIDSIARWAPGWLGLEPSAKTLAENLRGLGGSIAPYAEGLLGNVLGIGSAVVGAIFEFLSIALFTFYLVADGPKLRRAVCALFRPDRQRDLLWAWNVAIDKTGGYLYSRLLLAVLSGAVTFGALTLLGVPFAASLAVWTGVVSQFVPVVGTYIAAVPPVLVALTASPITAVLAIAYYVVYQQVENYFFSPRITARTMQLHPAVAFGAVVAGGSLLGAVGAFLALPAAAIVQASLATYVRRHEVMEDDLTSEV